MSRGLPIAIAGGILGIFALGIFAFIVMLFLVKVLWAWTVPDLFPGAVEQGLVAASISWYTALKVAIFLAVLAGISGARHKAEN